MPDEMVEKAQTLDDAIDNALIAWGMGWDMDGVMACLKEAKDRAALSAANAEPVATEAAIRVDEREKCAKVADQTQREADAMLAAERDSYQQAYFNGQIFAAEEIATAIRARGET